MDSFTDLWISQAQEGLDFLPLSPPAKISGSLSCVTAIQK
jgi:hypothetical protein